MTEEPIRPWYKEPWPWVLITIIVLPIIIMVIRLNIYSDYKVEMVVDDYYKKGKAINQEFDRERLAKDYGIAIFAQFKPDRLLLDINKNQKAPKELASVIVSFYHPTQVVKDINLMATMRGDGLYTANLPENMKGKWQVTIEPYNKTWKVQKTIILPTPDKVLITP